jgi:hypothetical protein
VLFLYNGAPASIEQYSGSPPPFSLLGLPARIVHNPIISKPQVTSEDMESYFRIPARWLVTSYLLAQIRAQSCYNWEGEELGWYSACDPDADVSLCCGSSDYCMTNGLCMNAGGNQMIAQQGCTDPGYGDNSTCGLYCTGQSGT